MNKHDVIVIGQGYAGLMAAGLCAKAGLKAASFEQETFGGLVLNINHLDPSPAPAIASGMDLASELAMQNMDLGVAGVSAQVTGIARGASGLFVVSSSDGDHVAPHVVVASGARLRKLGLPREEELHGRGVSYCSSGWSRTPPSCRAKWRSGEVAGRPDPDVGAGREFAAGAVGDRGGAGRLWRDAGGCEARRRGSGSGDPGAEAVGFP